MEMCAAKNRVASCTTYYMMRAAHLFLAPYLYLHATQHKVYIPATHIHMALLLYAYIDVCFHKV